MRQGNCSGHWGPMSKHDEAIAAFHQGRSADALHLLQELLDAGETSDLWNDWAAVQLGAGRVSQAEEGFSRALELEPKNAEASANLGDCSGVCRVQLESAGKTLFGL